MRRLALCLILAALPATAQDRQGNNTPGDWVVTHQQHFGLWDSVCDERTEDGTLRQRCYIRYVDVFSPRPDFAAHFLFIVPSPDGITIQYGSERGTRFAEAGNRIEKDGATVWSTQRRGCLTGGNCEFDGQEAEDMYLALRGGGNWLFDFTDRHGKAQNRNWDLTPFDTAARDFETQSAARGLR